MATTLTTWDPFKQMERFEEELGKLFARPGAPSGTWMPAVDVEQTPAEIVFTFDLPGMSPEDVKIATDGTVNQQGQPLGKLDVVSFDEGSLIKQGNNYFRTTDPAAATFLLLEQPLLVDHFADGDGSEQLPELATIDHGGELASSGAVVQTT